jgi:hypothetical protein
VLRLNYICLVAGIFEASSYLKCLEGGAAAVEPYRGGELLGCLCYIRDDENPTKNPEDEKVQFAVRELLKRFPQFAA